MCLRHAKFEKSFRKKDPPQLYNMSTMGPADPKAEEKGEEEMKIKTKKRPVWLSG